jgi:thiamine pyrophosphate-dependent acetolactate synthase large subunit-like protein
MRKTITGIGGTLLIQTLKDTGVEYLFTNPGSAETGIFAALAEDNRPYVIDVTVAREGVGADSTWYQDWKM